MNPLSPVLGVLTMPRWKWAILSNWGAETLQPHPILDMPNPPAKEVYWEPLPRPKREMKYSCFHEPL